MIIIGFIGHSGSGKSTLAKEMKKNIPNSRYIDGDFYMYETFSHFKELTDEMWGDSIYNSKGEITFTCVVTGGEKGKYFTKQVWPWLNEQLEKEIETAKKEGIECLIFDWIGLPSVDTWKKLDVKVRVISDDEKRYEMLLKRKHIGCNKELAQKREAFFSFEYDNKDTSMVTLKNDYTEECKLKNLQLLLKTYDRLK